MKAHKFRDCSENQVNSEEKQQLPRKDLFVCIHWKGMVVMEREDIRAVHKIQPLLSKCCLKRRLLSLSNPLVNDKMEKAGK